MRLRFPLLLAGLAAAESGQAVPSPSATQPQQAPAPQRVDWLKSDSQILLVPARVALPLRAGKAEEYGYNEPSFAGESIDNAVWYRSADQALNATVYIYYPGLPHAGVAALATDHSIRGRPPSPVEVLSTRVVDVGKAKRAAIRTDYADHAKSRAIAMAYIKAGRWLIKIRVIAPEARRTDLEETLQALLDGIQIGPANPVHEAAPIATSDCAPELSRISAKPLPDPPLAEFAALGFLATLDGGGIEATAGKTGEREDLPSRIPETLCFSGYVGGKPVFRAAPGPARSIDGRTMLLLLVSDAGDALEVVHAENLGGYILLLHQMGETHVAGRFDGVPSDAQIMGIVSNPNSAAARTRVPVRFRPGEGPRMFLPSLQPATPPAPAPPTT